MFLAAEQTSRGLGDDRCGTRPVTLPMRPWTGSSGTAARERLLLEKLGHLLVQLGRFETSFCPRAPQQLLRHRARRHLGEELVRIGALAVRSASQSGATPEREYAAIASDRRPEAHEDPDAAEIRANASAARRASGSAALDVVGYRARSRTRSDTRRHRAPSSPRTGRASRLRDRVVVAQKPGRDELRRGARVAAERRLKDRASVDRLRDGATDSGRSNGATDAMPRYDTPAEAVCGSRDWDRTGSQ